MGGGGGGGIITIKELVWGRISRETSENILEWVNQGVGQTRPQLFNDTISRYSANKKKPL